MKKIAIFLTAILLFSFISATSLSDLNLTVPNIYSNNYNFTEDSPFLSFDGQTISFLDSDFNTTYDNRYYLKSNPYGFFNLTDFSISDYYTKTQIQNFYFFNLSNFPYTHLSNFTNDGVFINWGHATNGTLALSSDLNNYYLNSNPFSFLNESNADLLYYSITNPFSFTNKTLLSEFTNDLGIGNWTADKPNYYTSTQTDTEIQNANTSLKNYADNIFLRNDGDTATGQYDFNGGWTSDGLSIIDGDLYAQTVYAYNITGLDVSTLNINGSIVPQSSLDNQFDLGEGALRWKTLYLGTSLINNGSAYFGGNVGIGTTNPTYKLYINDSYTNGLAIDAPSSPVQRFKVAGVDKWGFLTNHVGTDDFGIYDYTGTPGYRLVIMNGTGNVGIGTTNPTQKLEVNGNVFVRGPWLLFEDGEGLSWGNTATYIKGSAVGTTADYISFGTRGLSGGERMRIDSTGNVGIGTTTPVSKLSLYDNTDNSAVDVRAYTGGLDILNNGAGVANTYSLIRLGTWGASGALSTHDGSFIQSKTTANNEIDLSFGRYLSTGEINNYVTIKNDGNVGIGTTSPGTKLQIDHSGNNEGALQIGDYNSVGSNTGIYLRSTGNSSISVGGTGNLYFRDGGTTGDINMAIQGSTGNVGIGTTAPTSKLEVNGVTNSTGGFSVGANAGITGNYSVGDCWNYISGGIITATNCTAL